MGLGAAGRRFSGGITQEGETLERPACRFLETTISFPGVVANRTTGIGLSLSRLYRATAGVYFAVGAGDMGVFLETKDLDVRFTIQEEIDGGYMIFGGVSTSHKNSIGNVTIAVSLLKSQVNPATPKDEENVDYRWEPRHRCDRFRGD